MVNAWQSGFLLLLILILALLLLALLTTNCSWFSLKPLPVAITNYTSTTHFVTVFPHRRFKQSSEKVIMLWTDYFGSRTWEFRERFFRSCNYTRCRVTSDRSKLTESDAVLFNSRSLDKTKDFPQTRTPEQVWVLHNSEPPYYIYVDMDRYQGMFNWTSWFRKDADVYSPYGNFQKRATDKKIKLPNFFASKKTLSYWAASSCTDRSRRYRVIAQLQKYMDVDTYGACGRLRCPKSSPVCNSLLRDYKFVFAFENGQCRDYVTEKFWGALAREQVPVVLGGADYEAIAPPGSFINVRDFKTVEDLANHLIRVGGSEELYNSYFSWRKHFELTEDKVIDWCGLCEKLHDPGKQAQVYTDLRGWMEADSCSLYSIWGVMTDNLARLFFLLGL